MYNIILHSEKATMNIIKFMDVVYLYPAPWRKKLQNASELLQDWQQGKDFKIKNGPYCSIRDLEHLRENFSRIFIVCNHINYYSYLEV